MDKDKTDFLRDRLNGFKINDSNEQNKPSVEDGLKTVNKFFLFLCRIFGFWGGQYFVIAKFFSEVEPFGFLESVIIYMGLYALFNIKAPK